MKPIYTTDMDNVMAQCDGAGGVGRRRGQATGRQDAAGREPPLQLDRFLPYRFSILAKEEKSSGRRSFHVVNSVQFC